MQNNIFVVIPARGGSVSVPEKNLTYFNGTTLLEKTIQLACSITEMANVIVSTNDVEISQVALSRGVRVLDRPTDLSGDDVTLDPVVFNACEQLNIFKSDSVVITLQVTSPNLTKQTLLNAILYMHTENLDTLISVKNCNHLTWRKELNKTVPNYSSRLNRQYMSETYQETGAFLITKYTCMTFNNRIGPNVGVYLLPDNEADDIDDMFDYCLALQRAENRKIVFKVIGNKVLGTGHVFNCLELARRLPDYEKFFFVTPQDILAIEILKSKKYDVQIVDEDEINKEISKYQPNLIVLDKLDTTIDEIRELKSSGASVISFEDLGAGSHYTDMTINPLYPTTVSKGSILSGPEYFLPKSNFFQPRTDNIDKRDLLVFFGGTDPSGHTERFLRELKKSVDSVNFTITILLGLGADISEESLEYLEKSQNITLQRFSHDICGLIHQHRLALTSAGRTMYELAFLKKPFIVCFQNDRERSHFTELKTTTLIPTFDEPNELLINEISTLLADELVFANLKASLANIKISSKAGEIEQNVRRLMRRNV